MTNLTSLSKFISLVLRHRPDEFDLSMDDDGFARFEDLFAVVNQRFSGSVLRADIDTIISGDEHGKKRFEQVEGRVRAIFGHSGGVPEIKYPSVQPPDVLFHGTIRRFVPQILLQGLTPQSRQYVHLTTNREEAERVGRRHGRDFVLLSVKAAEAYQAGVIFYQADAERYLAQHIPPALISDA